MARYFYVASLGVVGAIIIHLAMVVMLPIFSTNTSWNYFVENVAVHDPVELTADSNTPERNFMLDPLFRNFACRFDLNDGAVRVTADGDSLFWSLSAFDSRGNAFFSANDRIADDAQIDIVIVNQRQLRSLRQSLPDELAASLVAPTTIDEGFVLLRVFTPDESWTAESQVYFDTMACQELTDLG